jgi:hypothetical protein
MGKGRVGQLCAAGRLLFVLPGYFKKHEENNPEWYQMYRQAFKYEGDNLA